MHLLFLITSVRLRERGHCYLPFALLPLPAVCVTDVTCHLRYCRHLPFALLPPPAVCVTAVTCRLRYCRCCRLSLTSPKPRAAREPHQFSKNTKN
ncbi:hypothetical protein [Methanimicrococcus blatticola]|uniref:hypothetical protein n=1 Tax=Methanimicrococcus blatticola TaxID=91560 RepID=UPI0010615F0A|nr:hypothetical protein [Methanimicrococcus blatticola]MBZ3935564.1 hypothetical protein [Methanimicrococcus blatticola]MCC2509207.1 hypothetical protein [Methanimicrococcus blatticola]